MSDNLKYRVLPHEPKLQPIPPPDNVFLIDSERESLKGLGVVEASILGVAIFVVISILSGSVLRGLIFASIITVVIMLWTKYGDISELKRIKAEKAEKAKQRAEAARQHIEYANQSEIRRVEGEAASLTSSLTKTYESSTKLTSELLQHLNYASGWLRQADTEYKDNAFSPFWDAIENAATQLATFQDKANQLSKSADEYYRNLDGRKHTFPIFPANASTIPDHSSIVDELRRIVRMGQTNFQFANIWEHRRTREVLIAGFRTLGEAVNNLGATVEYSISNLQQSLSSGVARLVQEEIRTREALDKRMVEQNRMLDNIQHNRKPGVTDSPSRD